MNNPQYPPWIGNLYSADSVQAKIVFHSLGFACVLSFSIWLITRWGVVPRE
jgi:hypothetical protein